MPEGDGREAGDEADPSRIRAHHSAATCGMGGRTTNLNPPSSALGLVPRTICISSQWAAPSTASSAHRKAGLQRNLTAGEIAGQVSQSSIASGPRRRDRVEFGFYGHGRAIPQLRHSWLAVRLLVREVASAERMTVSTSGIVPASSASHWST